MTESNHKESRKKAREFIQAFEKAAWVYMGSGKPEELTRLYNEATTKAEEYKHYPHYLIALIRSPWRFRRVLSDYEKNFVLIRNLMVAGYGEEQTKAFLVGIEPTA